MAAKYKVGESVEFKSDVEQCATIIKVNKVQSWNGKWKFTYTLKAPMDGFSGDYIKNCREYEIDEEDIFDY